MPEPSAFEVELAIEQLKSHKYCDQNPAELIKAGGRTIHSKNHELIYSTWNTKELPGEWEESIIVPVYMKGDKQIVIIIGAYHFYQLCTKFYPSSYCKG